MTKIVAMLRGNYLSDSIVMNNRQNHYFVWFRRTADIIHVNEYALESQCIVEIYTLCKH